MKNYVIVAIIIILIIVAVVWFKSQTPEVIAPEGEQVTAPVEEAGAGDELAAPVAPEAEAVPAEATPEVAE